LAQFGKKSKNMFNSNIEKKRKSDGFLQAKDLKESAKALRQKRENESALQQVEELTQKAGEDAALVRRKRSCGCCCCCCCCGCGRKKRDIFQVGPKLIWRCLRVDGHSAQLGPVS
jgi:hypothetical protein